MITDWLRSPAQFQHTFAQEPFLDQLAFAAGQDPVQFRLKYMTDDRLIAVLNAAAQAANWDTRPSPNLNMVKQLQLCRHRSRRRPYREPGGLQAQVERGITQSTRGPLFLSTSRRNRAQPITLWFWSKVKSCVGTAAALAQAGVAQHMGEDHCERNQPLIESWRA